MNGEVVAGKVHGSLARAGKVRGQTPKVAKQDKRKQPRGRAHKRMQYNRRFVTAGHLLPPCSPISCYMGTQNWIFFVCRPLHCVSIGFIIVFFALGMLKHPSGRRFKIFVILIMSY